MFSPFETLQVEIFGASHANEIGVRVEGFPRGKTVDAARVQEFVDTRKAGQNPWSTPRKEPDEVIFKSGLQDGKLTGGPVLAVIENVNKRSGDYSPYATTPRPSHADYVAIVKDGDKAQLAGGGRFSGRMTAPLCIAGGIALQLLAESGVTVGAYVKEIGGVVGKGYDQTVTPEEIDRAVAQGNFALSRTEEMTETILNARKNGDSVGGKIECVVFGLPVGVGDALFDGLEGKIASSVFAVPAVKAVEFGLGTGFAEKKGSEVNDAFCIENRKIGTRTNNNGGLNGGITNGMPVTVRVTMKPTPSISLPQKTVNLATMEETTIEIKGRHDACIVPRAVAGVKAAVALAVLDALLTENKL